MGENEKKVEDVEKKRFSKISKSISRKFNVAKYENLVIHVSYEEEVEWGDLKTRQKKSEDVTKLLLIDFEQTKKEVFAELGLEEKTAFMENPLEE